jgi:AAA+ ATPase superfamily predicted ATPase
MADIIGRTDEIASLQALYDAEAPQFLAVYGRRRIGKTFLISEFFHGKGLYFELAGIKDAPLKVQLGNFAREYADVFNSGKPVTSGHHGSTGCKSLWFELGPASGENALE